jgi:hypothetical protein
VAFPDTAVIDNFNRANADVDGQTCSDGVHTWGSEASPVGTSGMTIVSNELTSDAAGYGGAFIAGDFDRLASGKTGVEVHAHLASAGGAGKEYYIWWSASSITGSYDGFMISYVNGELKVWRWDNASPTQLGATVSETLADGDGIGAKHDNDGSGTIRCFKHEAGAWTELTTRTDTTYDVGRIGCEVNNNATFLDDLGGGEAVAAGAGLSIPVAMASYRRRRA